MTRILFPREHGAWSMLLLPFLAGLAAAGTWHWLVIPAGTAALALLFAREPLIVLARQRLVWRDARPETAAARRTLAVSCAVAAVCGAVLVRFRPARPLLALAAAGFLLLAVSVWAAVRNRHRSLALQVATTAFLGSSALLASIAAAGAVVEPAWWVWAFSSLHACAAVVIVRVRLEARIAAKKSGSTPGSLRPLAGVMVLAAGAAAVALGLSGRPWLAAASGVSAAIHALELHRLRSHAELSVPLVRVGLRAMAVSIAFTLLLVAGLA